LRLDGLLRAHAFMRVERPPELWEAAAEDTTLVPLLGEMIAARLAAAGARYAYTRSFDGKGTITVFFAREA